MEFFNFLKIVEQSLDVEFSPSIRKAAVFDREVENKNAQAKFQPNSNGYGLLNRFGAMVDEDFTAASSPPKPQIRKSSVKKSEELFSARSRSPAFDVDFSNDDRNTKSSRKNSVAQSVLASFEEPKSISRDVSPIKTARDSPIDDFFSQDDDKKEAVAEKKTISRKSTIDSDDELFNSTIKGSEVKTQNDQLEKKPILEKQFSNASLGSASAKSESPKKVLSFDEDEKEVLSKKDSYEDLFKPKAKDEFSDGELSAGEKRSKFTKSMSNGSENESKSPKRIIKDDPFGDYGADNAQDEDDDFEKMLMTKKREQMSNFGDDDDEGLDDDFGTAPKTAPRGNNNIFSKDNSDDDSF